MVLEVFFFFFFSLFFAFLCFSLLFFVFLLFFLEWGISLRARLHRPRSELPDYHPRKNYFQINSQTIFPVMLLMQSHT